MKEAEFGRHRANDVSPPEKPSLDAGRETCKLVIPRPGILHFGSFRRLGSLVEPLCSPSSWLDPTS